MDSSFFSKIGAENTQSDEDETLDRLKKLMAEHPEWIAELLSKTDEKQ